jgi:hypothetical protein
MGSLRECAILNRQALVGCSVFAALLGALPLAPGTGMGYERCRPLGITIVRGLILSQMLSLYTTPVVYLAYVRDHSACLNRGVYFSGALADSADPSMARRPVIEST